MSFSLFINGAAGKMGNIVKVRATKFPQIKSVFLFDIKESEGISLLPKGKVKNSKKAFLIDFSSPQGAMSALEFCVKNKMPAVIGSTGFEQKEILKKASKKIPVFFSPNMSMAVNLTFIISQILAKNLDFDIHIHETHHTAKKDAPSGTALKYAEFIAKAGKKLSISSARVGTITGEHEIVYAGPGEKVTLSHCAYTRDIFADGAIKAGLWLYGKRPGLYSFMDIFKVKI